MVYIAGMAKMNVVSPNPRDARRQSRGEYPASEKIVLE
jgi:hypothetical protein